MDEHTADLRNVNEGDVVDLTFTKVGLIRATCENHIVENADPRSGEVRETRMWFFEPAHRPDEEIVVSIVDGLRSSESDPEFPIHKEGWHVDEEESVGYVSKVKNSGVMEA